MATRRELLKYFGIGTIISPIAAQGVTAKLIEAPNVEIISPRPVRVLDLSRAASITVSIGMEDGSTHSFRSPYVHGSGRICQGDDTELQVDFSRADGNSSPAVFERIGQINGFGSL